MEFADESSATSHIVTCRYHKLKVRSMLKCCKCYYGKEPIDTSDVKANLPECEQCGELYAYERELSEHIELAHSKGHTICCEECHQFFDRNLELTQYMNKPYLCGNCGMRFLEYKMLQSHLKIHSRFVPHYI